MRTKMMVMGIAFLLAVGAGCGQKVEEETGGALPAPTPRADIVRFVVTPATGENQFQLDLFVTNSDSVAGMPIAVRIFADQSKMYFDSVSYTGGRVEHFQLKTQNADSVEQTLLLGLIADLSGSVPSLGPGTGKALTLFYTAESPIQAQDVKIEEVVVPPANRLEFNVLRDGRVSSVTPQLVVEAGEPGT
jgi:hypothetical protein